MSTSAVQFRRCTKTVSDKTDEMNKQVMMSDIIERRL